MTKRILITGGLGFIGRELTHLLIQDREVHVVIVDSLTEQVHGPSPDYSELIEHPQVTFIHDDICAPGVLRSALKGVNVVYHFAAETGTGQSMYEIQKYYSTNVTGTAILMEEIVRNTDHRPDMVLLSSSRSVYGEGAYVAQDEADAPDAKRYFPDARNPDEMRAGNFDFTADGKVLVPTTTKETDPAKPGSIYAASKLAQEHICEIACASVGVRYHALRLQNVYGPGQSLKNPYTGIISIFTNILRQGGDINVYEDGLESRDFVYVGDVAQAFLRAQNMPETAPKVINVGTGERVTVLDLVTALENKLGTDGKWYISGDFRPGDIRHNFADIQRLKDSMDLDANTSLSEGIGLTVDWALTQPIEDDRTGAAAKELAQNFKG